MHVYNRSLKNRKYTHTHTFRGNETNDYRKNGTSTVSKILKFVIPLAMTIPIAISTWTLY